MNQLKEKYILLVDDDQQAIIGSYVKIGLPVQNPDSAVLETIQTILDTRSQ